MSQALYRKYRSRSLDQVLGQEHITSILARALEKGKIAHAYLLTGPRGVGKTSVARILAHEINGLPYDEDSTHLDIIEIDAASNNGVDDIRALREKAQVAPVSAAKKIYIIDEVHMLSKPAFNALLKTLEEPPAHIVFILATTDADKLPATILSRVQQFYFRPITSSVIAKQLQYIAKSEGFTIETDAANIIAEHSRGGFRDAISLLDQLSPLADSDSPLAAEQVTQHLGLIGNSAVDELIATFYNQDLLGSTNLLRQLEKNGTDAITITHQLLRRLHSSLYDQPENIELITRLIEVTKHPHPELKLLTIFINHSSAQSRDNPKPKTIIKQESVSEIRPASKISQKESRPKEDKREEPTSKPPAKPGKSKPITSRELNWEEVISKAKKSSAGLSSLLSKCSYDIEDGRLTIYTGNKFTQKKLDDIKFRSVLSGIVSEMMGEVEIVFVGGNKPPKDQELAKIAEIMGGGQEVNIEEIQ